MTIPQYFRMAMRESRRARGRIALFAGCIAVGVAAIVVVAGLSTSVQEGVRSEGRKLMAADMIIEGKRPVPAEVDTVLVDFVAGDSRFTGQTVQRAEVKEFVSVVLSDDEKTSQLAQVKVVQGGYPFYGQLQLDPAGSLDLLLTADTTVVAPELMERMGLKIGDALRIGGSRFRVAGVVVAEPDKLAVTFALGPRVFLSPEGLNRTALLDRGARVDHKVLLKLPSGATSLDLTQLERAIEAKLPDAEYFRIRSFSEAQPALRRTFDRMGRYLGLVGLLSLLVGGVGVAQVARAWLASRMDDIAILRCIGATSREVVLLFLLQVVAMALAASLIGAALGTALHALVPTLFGDLLPPELIRPWQPAAIVRGVALGLAVALVFTLPLLVGLRRVPPVRVLRRDAEPVNAGLFGQLVAAILVLSGVWIAASLQAESWRFGTYFLGGIVASVLLLALAAMALSRLARLLPRDAGGVRLRHGLTHLARPGAATIGAIIALGLGVTFVFATHIVERHFGEQLKAELPTDAPSTFLIDVQPDQWDELATLLRSEGATGIESQPLVTARLAAIDGVPVDELTERRRSQPTADANQSGDRPRPNRGTLTREQRITYGPALPRGNRIITGKFPAGPEVPNGVSVEENFAGELGVQVGSTIGLDVQGVPVELKVTSLRTVDWRTFGINFFLFAEPGPLNDAPQQRVAVARIATPDLPRVQAKVVAAMPNVTVIHIRDVMDKVNTVLGNLSIATRALGLFTIAAGVIVLGGTIAATQAKRAKEVALLKTIGMTRRDVATVFAIEYALTGMVSAIVGVTAGATLGWAVISKLMELPWSLRIGELAIAGGTTVALAVVAGLAASARALTVRPVEVLRAE